MNPKDAGWEIDFWTMIAEYDTGRSLTRDDVKSFIAQLLQERNRAVAEAVVNLAQSYTKDGFIGKRADIVREFADELIASLQAQVSKE